MRYVLALLLMWGAGSAGAATFDAVSTGEKGDTGTTLTISHTVTASSGNRVLYGTCTMRNRTSTGSATYNGVSTTAVRSDTHTSTNIRTYLFRLIAPATGTHDFVFTESAATAAVCRVQSFTDAPQVTPETDAQGDCTQGTSATLTLSTGSNDILIDGMGMAITGSGTPGANQTEDVDLAASTNTLTLAGSRQAGADGGVMSYTASAGAVTCYVAASIGHSAFATPVPQGSPIFFK